MKLTRIKERKYNTSEISAIKELHTTKLVIVYLLDVYLKKIKILNFKNIFI